MNDFVHVITNVQPYILAVIFCAIYVAEHIIPERRELLDHRHDLLNVLLGSVNLAVTAAAGYYLQKLLQVAEIKRFGLLNQVDGIQWLKIIVGFIFADLFMYWWHRSNHEIDFLWRFHELHHKDEKLNSTSAVRFHTVEIVLSFVIRFCLYPLLGISATAIILYSFVLFPVIAFHHSNVCISANTDNLLRNIFVTPFMHRTHHSKIITETNSNYGSVFPYWDKLFNSYTAKLREAIEFGIEKEK